MVGPRILIFKLVAGARALGPSPSRITRGGRGWDARIHWHVTIYGTSLRYVLGFDSSFRRIRNRRSNSGHISVPPRSLRRAPMVNGHYVYAPPAPFTAHALLSLSTSIFVFAKTNRRPESLSVGSHSIRLAAVIPARESNLTFIQEAPTTSHEPYHPCKVQYPESPRNLLPTRVCAAPKPDVSSFPPPFPSRFSAP